jgi:ssDNA thymidine ADP-ribosyltransferase, DarT
MFRDGLHCRSSSAASGPFVQIGNPELIERRQSRIVECPPHGTLSDYIPFYFTPYTPMMYNIKTGYNGMQRRPMKDILILVSSLRKLARDSVSFVFSDRHAYLRLARFTSDLANLSWIDWPSLNVRIPLRKSAEWLILSATNSGIWGVSALMDNTVQWPSGTGFVAELVGMQMRNMRALSTAQQQMLDGLSMLAKQQLQTMDSSRRRAFGIGQATSSPFDLRALIGTRIDDLKSSILDAQANSNAASEIMARSLGEVASTLQTRMMAALDEVKALLEQAVPDGVSLTRPGAANLMVVSQPKQAA